MTTDGLMKEVLPQKTYWGVDSASRISQETLQKLPRVPHFWMRYLNHTPGVCDGLTHEELTFALNHGIRVGLIDSGIAQQNLEVDNHFILPAVERIHAAIDALRITNMVTVYLDAEGNTVPNLGAINNWCNQSIIHGWIPGLYFNGKVLSHQKAATVVSQKRGQLWDCEPEYTSWEGLVIPFSQMEARTGVCLRQYQINQCEGTVDFNGCTDAAYKLMVH